MNSRTVSSFWEAYGSLPESTRESARKAYRIWSENPLHPSLHFKCVSPEERIWSLRITRGYRALCLFEGDDVTWFWIGSHKENRARGDSWFVDSDADVRHVCPDNISTPISIVFPRGGCASA